MPGVSTRADRLKDSTTHIQKRLLPCLLLAIISRFAPHFRQSATFITTRALKKLTPPPTIVQLIDIEPLREGSVSKFTLWVGPLPLRWTAVHKNVSLHGFTDIQIAGPAKKWEHTHTFISLSQKMTEIREQIEYEHKSGFWGIVTRLLFSKPNLTLMFTYRKLATRWYLRKFKT